jgi:hypothetical protein
VSKRELIIIKEGIRLLFQQMEEKALIGFLGWANVW